MDPSAYPGKGLGIFSNIHRTKKADKSGIAKTIDILI